MTEVVVVYHISERVHPPFETAVDKGSAIADRVGTIST